ncbi:carbohydrate ABC transporter substrate-binding protein [Senegalia massiliensis]|uniref:Carbohydrate ABC transporter substrate-binding protein n=1 Tax=Senegalia massiliensis TaxID=1720316 RepID=A0A845QYJ2_9CLOT|nr:carbohydrate ABC transporter substrate-binding protein [Senegalia massiliensis]NBI07351.1 carbohydrate ABC transporter substrate-binding protein [Senegalia massiliensis]
MKRFLAVLLALSLVFTTVACSNDSSDSGENDSGDGEKVLKIAGLNGGYKTEHWEAIAKKFEESHEGVKVELTLEKNISEVLRPQIQAGNVPDIIYLAVGGEGKLTDTLIKEKAIQDIDDVLEMDVPGEDVKVKDKLIDGFTDTLITNPYEDGKTYLAPLFYAPTGLFYNANNFDGKYEMPETWDDFMKLGEEAKGDMALFTYPTTGYFDAFFYALLNETGGPELFNKAMDYDVEAWKSDEAKKAFEIIGDIAKYTHENTVSQANGENFTKNQQLILDNEALFIPNGTWLPGEMKDAPRADGFEWGFSALPKVSEDGDSYSYTFFEQMYIPNDAKNADLAKEFMAYMYSDEAAQIIYDKSGAVQPIKGASDMMSDDDPNKLFYSIYDEGAKAAMGGFASAPPVEGVDLTSGTGILFGTINSVVTGDKTVDEWHGEVVEAVEKISEAKQN